VYAQLGLSEAPDKLSAAAWGGLIAGHTIGDPPACSRARSAAKLKNFNGLYGRRGRPPLR